MKIVFIEYPKCTTCQKAKRWLEASDVKFEDRNIVHNNPSKDELKKWISSNDYDIKKWFNTSGLKYKELNLKEKLNDMTDDEKIDLLSRDGMLVKRPLLVIDEKVLIGFKEETWKTALQDKER